MSTLLMHKCSLLFAASFLFVLTVNTPPAAAQECCEVTADPNTATIPQAGENLGTSVAVDGGTAVAGAPGFDFSIGEDDFPDAGRAIVFNFTGASWVQVDDLRPFDAAAFDGFGRSVALDGDFAVIGARGNDDDGEDSGSAYIFERVGGSWFQAAKLTASDAEAGDLFGHSVAINGDLAVIGALFGDAGNEEGTGAVYVFDRNHPNPDDWGEVAKLYASDAFINDRFGTSVSIDGPVIVVGAPLANIQGIDDEGKAYIFRFEEPDWVQEDILTASDASEDDHFGTSVSVAGDLAVIGAPFKDSDELLNDEGAAYVFRFDGDDWIQEAKFSGCNEAEHDQFGTSVAINGNVAVIGAIQPVGPVEGNGTADAFRYLGSGWAQVGKPNASDGESGDRFGQSVSISGDFVFIGAFAVDAENPPPFQIGGFYVFDNFDAAEACDCPWDLNGDGNVGVPDLLALLAAWGPCPDPPAECPADFDGDGSVGVSDLLALLANWGPCLNQAIPLKNAQDCMDKFYPNDMTALIACIEAFGG